MSINETLAAAIRHFRDERGLTQSQLAEAANLHPNSVARIERGERAPDWATACRLADALGVRIDRLREAPKR